MIQLTTPIGETIIKRKYNGDILKQSLSMKGPTLFCSQASDEKEIPPGQNQLRENYSYDSPATGMGG